MNPTLTFLGATGTVTGSRFLIERDGTRILVDCGLFQGPKRLRERNWAAFPAAPASIDAVVLTHAHLDHCGYLPALVRDGFAGPIFATKNTIELAKLVLRDSAHLQEEEAEYANQRGFSKHHPALPLYTTEDAEHAIRQLHVAPFGHRVDIAPGIAVELHPAGHILGSSSAHVVIGDRSVVVSGDVGRPGHPLLLPPQPPPPCDTLVVESTYGNRAHEPEDKAVERFAAAVRRVAERGGVMVIPAFAVDRTEVILMTLRQLATDERIPQIPVYADSPMALAVLDVYRTALTGNDPEVRPGVPADPDPFDPGQLHEARSRDESIELNDLRGPHIIISSSGMATGGRVLHHLANRLPDRRNAIVLVGFQAEETRGRLLADGLKAIKMLGRYVPVKAEIVKIEAFSSHADAGEMTTWLGGIEREPDMTYLVHGEPAASTALQERLEDQLGWACVVPRAGERVRID